MESEQEKLWRIDFLNDCLNKERPGCFKDSDIELWFEKEFSFYKAGRVKTYNQIDHMKRFYDKKNPCSPDAKLEYTLEKIQARDRLLDRAKPWIENYYQLSIGDNAPDSDPTEIEQFLKDLESLK